MKYIFIVNPVSGNKKHNHIIENIHKYMAINDLEYEIIFTKAKGDATKIAKSFTSEKNIVIYSVGGDGTLNEIVNGIAGSNVRLGVIPAGSGNDFYKSLKIYKRKKRKIDLGKVNDKYFINIASIGIDAEICNNSNIFKKLKFPRSSIYDFSIIYTFFKFKYQNLKIEYKDEKYESKYLIVAVCNGKYYGGGYKIAPLASFDDNYFDVYFANKVPKLKMIGLINLLKQAKHEESPVIKKVKLKELTISSNQDIICNYDGETMISKKLEFKMIRDFIYIYNNQELVDNIIKK
ncbi:MAG: diacylglycerol kinase family lipid kinase [Bacilli bacterium]|nr:diacylglycerol kinase family lipid kinase [Bacilli bacterium]